MREGGGWGVGLVGGILPFCCLGEVFGCFLDENVSRELFHVKIDFTNWGICFVIGSPFGT
jgi:hypothetical protein